MSVPSGTPGADVPGPMDHVLVGAVAVPEGSPEALAFAGDGDTAASDDLAGDQSAAGHEDEGGQSLSDDGASTEDAAATDREYDEADRVDAATAEATADEADLAQYPERLRERFKSLTREERRELYEYAEGRVRPKLQEEHEADRQRAEDLKRKADEDEAERTSIRQKFGHHFGETDGDIELKDRDGNVVATRPNYAELTRLLGSRNGEDVLDDKYGMSLLEAHDWKDELEGRRELIPGLARHFDDQAWAKTAWKLSEGLKRVEGIDADAMVRDANGVDEVVERLATTLSGRYEKQLADQKKSYEDRIRTLTLNGEALKGQAAAGSSRRLETDGRTGGGADGEMTLEQYQRLSPEQAAKLPAAVIDRMTQKLTAGRR